jgi:signal transduction histidine kinase
MRSRLLVSTLAAVAVAIVLLGLPLSVAFQYLARQRTFAALEQEAERIQTTYRNLDDPAVQRELVQQIRDDDLRVALYVPHGGGFRRLWDTDRDARVPRFDGDLRQAAGQAGTGTAVGDGLLAVTLRPPGEDVLIRTLQPDRTVHDEVRVARLAIGTLTVVSLLAGMLVALWQGKRFAAPLEALAASARRLGDGDFSARAPRSGLPEPDEVASALDSTAARLATMLQRSRSFNADASHQLRTPLTALRLDLEALEQTGADPGLVAAAVAEADRLEATIAELLALAEAPRGDELLDIAQLAGERLDAWRALARAQGREVRLQALPVPPVRARAAALGQSLQVLLDNALEHGAGTITVDVAEVAGGVRLCVSDEGAGIPAERELATLFAAVDPRRDRAQRGTLLHDEGGLGLPLARSLVEAEGGRISIERARPGAVVCLLFPAARPVT